MSWELNRKDVQLPSQEHHPHRQLMGTGAIFCTPAAACTCCCSSTQIFGAVVCYQNNSMSFLKRAFQHVSTWTFRKFQHTQHQDITVDQKFDQTKNVKRGHCRGQAEAETREVFRWQFSFFVENDAISDFISEFGFLCNPVYDIIFFSEISAWYIMIIDHLQYRCSMVGAKPLFNQKFIRKSRDLRTPKLSLEKILEDLEVDKKLGPFFFVNRKHPKTLIFATENSLVYGCSLGYQVSGHSDFACNEPIYRLHGDWFLKIMGFSNANTPTFWTILVASVNFGYVWFSLGLNLATFLFAFGPAHGPP